MTPCRKIRVPPLREPSYVVLHWRHEQRDHHQCRCGSALCPRCGKAVRDREGWGIIEFVLLIGIPLGVVGFLPAFWVHGTNDSGGFKWTAATTYACLAWWAVLVLFAVLIWAGHRKPETGGRP